MPVLPYWQDAPLPPTQDLLQENIISGKKMRGSNICVKKLSGPEPRGGKGAVFC
jgi:hypothetical protein